MKNTRLILLVFKFFVFVLIFISCKKEEVLVEKITYPRTYDSKLNVLYDSSFIVKPGVIYSIATDLPKKTSIKIVCKPSDGKDWGAAGFSITEKNEFVLHNYYPDSMVFTAEGNGKTANVPVMFGAELATANTSIKFFIYENNSTSSTRIKEVKSY